MTLVFECDTHDVWLGGQDARKAIADQQANGIKIIVNSTSNEFGYHREQYYTPNCDMNAVTEALQCTQRFSATKKHSLEWFGQHLVDFEKQMLAYGGGLVHCRNGANRSPVYVAAYLMAKTGCTATSACKHLRMLRPIVDVTEPKYGNHVLPMTFLTESTDYLHRLFKNNFITFEMSELQSVVSSKELLLRLERFPRSGGNGSAWGNQSRKRTHVDGASASSDAIAADDDDPPHTADSCKLKQVSEMLAEFNEMRDEYNAVQEARSTNEALLEAYTEEHAEDTVRLLAEETAELRQELHDAQDASASLEELAEARVFDEVACRAEGRHNMLKHFSDMETLIKAFMGGLRSINIYICFIYIYIYIYIHTYIYI
jgi:hypothetical protein